MGQLICFRSIAATGYFVGVSIAAAVYGDWSNNQYYTLGFLLQYGSLHELPPFLGHCNFGQVPYD